VRIAASPTARLAVTGLLWVAAFSLLFTAGSSIGLWRLWAPAANPSPSPLPLRADLPAGLAFGVALGWTLWRDVVRRPKMSSGLPAAHGGAS
jgi:hypothetical protein